MFSGHFCLFLLTGSNMIILFQWNSGCYSSLSTINSRKACFNFNNFHTVRDTPLNGLQLSKIKVLSRLTGVN